jgi:hypothetical protein
MHRIIGLLRGISVYTESAISDSLRFLGAWRNLIDGIAQVVRYPDARTVKADTPRVLFDTDRALVCPIAGRDHAHAVIIGVGNPDIPAIERDTLR